MTLKIRVPFFFMYIIYLFFYDNTSMNGFGITKSVLNGFFSS